MTLHSLFSGSDLGGLPNGGERLDRRPRGHAETGSVRILRARKISLRRRGFGGNCALCQYHSQEGGHCAELDYGNNQIYQKYIFFNVKGKIPLKNKP